MAGIFLWFGLTMIVAFPILGTLPIFEMVGAIFMVIGCILLLVEKYRSNA